MMVNGERFHVCSPIVAYEISTCVAVSDSSIIILKSLNIVFAKITARLDLHEGKIFCSRIFDAMRGASGNIDGLTCIQVHFLKVNGDDSRAAQDEPVFHTMTVTLKAQTLSRIHDDSFDLMIILVGEHFIISPGPMLRFHKIF